MGHADLSWRWGMLHAACCSLLAARCSPASQRLHYRWGEAAKCRMLMVEWATLGSEWPTSSVKAHQEFSSRALSRSPPPPSFIHCTILLHPFPVSEGKVSGSLPRATGGSSTLVSGCRGMLAMMLYWNGLKGPLLSLDEFCFFYC